MKVVLLRVGVDSSSKSGGIQGPLLDRSGSFEYIPIPDKCNVDNRTYGREKGRHGRLLAEYFPHSRHNKMAQQSIHFDPEFETFTYGDPTRPKRSLRNLNPGNLLIFYCGLEGWGDVHFPPALYIMGYFEVDRAGLATDIGDHIVHEEFRENFHVRHPAVYSKDKQRGLVLVKGRPCLRSRLLKKAHRISSTGNDRTGKPLKILSPEMREIFGTFGGRESLQRSNPRWVKEDYVNRAADYVRSLD